MPVLTMCSVRADHPIECRRTLVVVIASIAVNSNVRIESSRHRRRVVIAENETGPEHLAPGLRSTNA
jgi:hypothetical protein